MHTRICWLCFLAFKIMHKTREVNQSLIVNISLLLEKMQNVSSRPMSRELGFFLINGWILKDNKGTFGILW